MGTVSLVSRPPCIFKRIPMCVITNHVHYVTKINQALLIFLVYIEKHGRPGYKDREW